ncbi:MAG TPA: cyclic nucleotide-binding domain-containing protein [Chitinophagaceae bacterium]|jgi:CRP-like cAMP-binding protein|nr:cyclic nucleotide-binding domain-containing protein [Chitinophagaceae bacterium]
MLLIEKVLLLKTTDIFQETPEPDLIDTASIAEEIQLDAGMAIFAKGDIGSCMYVIHTGSVRIHDGEHLLAVLKENDIFGELSLLDAETRSASATCAEDCLLLKLDQEPFYEILAGNANVLKGILKTLSRRLRILDEKSTSLQASLNDHLP